MPCGVVAMAPAMATAALQAWLLSTPEPVTSAYALGSDLFKRQRGLADVATRRKQRGAEVWAQKHAARGG